MNIKTHSKTSARLSPWATHRLRLPVWNTLLLQLLVWGLTGGTASGQTNILLRFDSLPSAQGWQYDGRQQDVGGGNPTDVPENTVFSIANGMLHQDSMSVAPRPQGENSYHFSNAIQTNLPFTLTARVHVLADSPTNGSAVGGFFFGLLAGGQVCGLYFGNGRILDAMGNQMATLDYSAFHDYGIQGGVGSNNTIQVFIDHQFIGTSTNETGNDPTINIVSFGDTTGGADARADINSFSFSQGGPQTAIFPAVEITWPSETNELYQVQWADQLNTNQWFNLGSSVFGNGSTNSVFDSTRASPFRFYRVITLP